MSRRAVFLDRDGVLNESLVVDGKPFAPRQLSDFKIYESAEQAVKILKSRGFINIVVTNQPDVGNGYVKMETIEAFHRLLRERIPIDDIEVCYASQSENSPRRKPAPGMLIDAAKKWQIDLSQSFIIGDRASDIEAGKSAGCCTIFIDRGYSEPKPKNPDYVASSLESGVDIILGKIN